MNTRKQILDLRVDLMNTLRESAQIPKGALPSKTQLDLLGLQLFETIIGELLEADEQGQPLVIPADALPVQVIELLNKGSLNILDHSCE